MNRTELLLTVVAEECAETAQRVSKALRFGLDEVQEGQSLTNAERIVYEYNDIVATMQMLCDEGLIKYTFDNEAIALKRVKLNKWLDYSTKKGIVVPEPTAPSEPSIPDHKGERVITWDKLDRIEKPSPHLKFTWSCPYCGKGTNELCTNIPTGLAEVICANDECEAFMYLEKLKEEE